MANEKTPVVWDDDAKKHRPLGSGEKMGGLSASSMISADSGNLLQQGSDGLMLVTGSSLADPRADNLLEESANGKLQVTSDRVVEWLEGHPQAAAALADAVKVVSEDSGNVIVQGSDKGAFMSKEVLTSAVSEMTPAQMSALADALRKAGGGLNVDPATGKLVVDFGSMDPNIMRNVVLSMVQQGGGISVDQNGKLYVDFDSMPTAKFEALLKSLKMQIPLTANMDVYVDGANGSDALVEGRGSRALPFKTIQACVNYVTQNYAVGPYYIYIHVLATATYRENINLPDFTRTSGAITIVAADFSNPPIITNASATNNVFYASGGFWYLVRLGIYGEFSSDGSQLSYFPGCVASGKATVSIRACDLSARFSGPAHGGFFEIRMVAAYDSSTVEFAVVRGYHTTISCTPGNATSSFVLRSETGSRISLPSTSLDASTADCTIVCSGSCRCFASCVVNSSIYVVGGGLHYQHFSGEMDGAQYQVTSGSGISLTGSSPFPGDSESSTVEASTYSWYKE